VNQKRHQQESDQNSIKHHHQNDSQSPSGHRSF